MEEWKKVRLGDILEEYCERNLEQKYKAVAVGKYGIRRREDIYSKELSKDISKNKVIKQNTLTIGMGSNQIDIGVLIENEKYCVSPAYSTYKIKNCDSRFLKYYLEYFNPKLSDLYMIISARQGKSVDKEGLLNYLIEIPSLEEQEKIVKILEKIDKIIFKYEKLLKEKNQFIKSHFVEMFENNEWNEVNLKDVSQKITDGEHGTVPRVEKGRLYLMARNITDSSKIDLTEISYIPEENHKKIYSRCNPEKDDLLLVCVGATIGKVALVPEMEEFSMARSVALIKPNKQLMNSSFLLYLMKSDYIQSQIKNCVHAAAQPGLYTNMIKDLKFKLPPIELQNQFSEFVKLIDKQKFELEKLIENYKKLKKGLMQKLLTGKVRVKI